MMEKEQNQNLENNTLDDRENTETTTETINQDSKNKQETKEESKEKTFEEKIIGTRSMFERKSFFGSKNLKVPETIVLDTFKPDPFVKAAIRQPSLIDGTFMFEDQASVTVNKKIIRTEGVRNTRAIKKKPSAPVISFYLFNQKRLIEF